MFIHDYKLLEGDARKTVGQGPDGSSLSNPPSILKRLLPGAAVMGEREVSLKDLLHKPDMTKFAINFVKSFC